MSDLNRYDASAYTAPEWVILGAHHQAGVMVYASQELSLAELRAEMRRDDDWSRDPCRVIPSSPRYHLTLTMRSYVMVLGADYQEALQRLFTHWNPPGPPPPRPAISGPLPALPEGKTP